MDGVSVASGIAGLITLALQVGEAIAVYVNSIRERSKTIQELHDELLLLGEVLSRLRDFLRAESARGKSIDPHSVLSQAISACRDRIERIGDRLKPVEGGKLIRTLDRLRWPFEQREVMQMVENLRRYSQTFQFAFTIEGCNLLSKASEDATRGLQEMLEVSKRITQLSVQMGLSAEESSKRAVQLEQIIALVPMLAKTGVEIKEMSHAIHLAELREQERRTTDILEWLAPVSSLHKHRDLQVKRAEGTGKWFLENAEFLRWIQESEHDLLCVGGPGAGKSVLCSLVVDHLRSYFRDRDVAVAYYYYDYSEQKSQNPSHFARSLLRQLCSTGRMVPSAVAEFYQRTRNDVKDHTWFHDLLMILRRVVTTYSRCFIVVDALDEADIQSQRSGFFEVIDAIRSSSAGEVKVLASSRPHVLALSFGGKFRDPVTVDILADPRDLRQFLTQAIGDHPDSEFIMDNDLREHIIDTLCVKANGMFLLPALQIRTILDQVTKADVKRTLLQLSTNLTQAFQSTIQRISNLAATRRNLAFRTMMWISHARRPLVVAEIQHALALRLDDDDLDRDNLPSVRTLVDCCCGLVEVDSESSIIRLVHHSLEEYLRDHDHGLFKDADLFMTRICLKYMSLKSMKLLPFQNRADFTSTMENLPFLGYAALEWGHHAYQVSAEDIKDLALPLLFDSYSLMTIARVRDHRSADFRHWKERAWVWASSGGAAISLCAAFGLAGLLRVVVAETQHNLFLEARNMYGSTPLHEAALYGHESIAEFLIDHGADLISTNNGQSNALFLAISNQQLPMVKLLLKHGRTQLDVSGPKGFTPLHKAAEQGDEEVVSLLLQAGALVAATDNQGATALHLASLRGYLSIARLLVIAGAFVHVKDKEGLCPLDFAATGGFTDLVEYLLENGGSIFHKGREFWTPLHRAARGGHTQTVLFLLQRRAGVLDPDFKGNIPLHLAVRSGKMETTRAILEHNPELRREQLLARDRKGSTPRVVAFFTAKYDIHKYLRAAEWEVLGSVRSSANQLTTAIEKGDVDAVREHLSHHAEALTTLDEDGQPPLHVALQEGQNAIVELLLQCDASVETAGYHGWRALHIAASLGSLELVELCLSHGANLTTRTHTQQTALHKAASSHSIVVVRRLIDAGASSSAVNDRGMTALHIAAHQNDLAIVRMLVLEYGVDVLARDRQGLDAAMWAERSAHLELLAFLRGEMRKAKILIRAESGKEKEKQREKTMTPTRAEVGNEGQIEAEAGTEDLLRQQERRLADLRISTPDILQ